MEKRGILRRATLPSNTFCGMMFQLIKTRCGEDTQMSNSLPYHLIGGVAARLSLPGRVEEGA
jgi:hypothetical protein